MRLSQAIQRTTLTKRWSTSIRNLRTLTWYPFCATKPLFPMGIRWCGPGGTFLGWDQVKINACKLQLLCFQSHCFFDFFEPNPRLWEFFEVRAFLKTLMQSVRISGQGHQYQQHLTILISWASNVQLFLGNACMPFQTMTHLCCKYPFNRVQLF